MARTAAAALMVAAVFSWSATARGQSMAGVSLQDADPALADESDEAPRTPPPPPGCCCCRLLPAPGPSERELTAMAAGGATAAGVAYLLTTIYILSQPRAQAYDILPVFGAIASAARSPLYDRSPPLLLFSAGVQAIGIFIAAAAGAELAARRRLLLDVGASPYGAGVSVTWRH